MHGRQLGSWLRDCLESQRRLYFGIWEHAGAVKDYGMFKHEAKCV